MQNGGCGLIDKKMVTAVLHAFSVFNQSQKERPKADGQMARLQAQRIWQTEASDIRPTSPATPFISLPAKHHHVLYHAAFFSRAQHR